MLRVREHLHHGMAVRMWPWHAAAVLNSPSLAVRLSLSVESVSHSGVFFSHNKSTSSTLCHSLSAKRTRRRLIFQSHSLPLQYNACWSNPTFPPPPLGPPPAQSLLKILAGTCCVCCARSAIHASGAASGGASSRSSTSRPRSPYCCHNPRAGHPPKAVHPRHQCP